VLTTGLPAYYSTQGTDGRRKMLSTLGMDGQNDKETVRCLDEQWTSTHTERERESRRCSSHSHHLRRSQWHGAVWSAAAVVYSCESNSRIVPVVDVWLITTDRALDPHTAPLIDQTNQEEYGDQRRCKLSPERLGARQTTLPATRAVNDERLLMLGIILACWNWPDVRVRSIRKHIRKVCRRNCQMQTYV